nr:2900_t:CDS:2 [Entrophospora candida]
MCKIYTAILRDGPYFKWNSKKLELERSGDHQIVLKELRKANENDQRWLDEVKSHCEINMNSGHAVGCYGLTKNPETNGYMLILSQYNDMGFCGPEDKPIGGICDQKFPDKLKKLLNQCWDVNPENRPYAKTLWMKIKGILRDLYNTDQNLQLKDGSKNKNKFNRLSNTTELIKSLKSDKNINNENINDDNNNHDDNNSNNSNSKTTNYYTRTINFSDFTNSEENTKIYDGLRTPTDQNFNTFGNDYLLIQLNEEEKQAKSKIPSKFETNFIQTKIISRNERSVRPYTEEVEIHEGIDKKSEEYCSTWNNTWR